LASLLVAIGLAACVDPSAKVATGFVRYGMDDARARCIGDCLETRLSIGQLRQLERAASAVDRAKSPQQGLTVADLIRVSAELKDPRVPLEVGRAAAGCGVLAQGAAR
jgi:hypothetical protein